MKSPIRMLMVLGVAVLIMTGVVLGSYLLLYPRSAREHLGELAVTMNTLINPRSIVPDQPKKEESKIRDQSPSSKVVPLESQQLDPFKNPIILAPTKHPPVDYKDPPEVINIAGMEPNMVRALSETLEIDRLIIRPIQNGKTANKPSLEKVVVNIFDGDIVQPFETPESFRANLKRQNEKDGTLAPLESGEKKGMKTGIGLIPVHFLNVVTNQIFSSLLGQEAQQSTNSPVQGLDLTEVYSGSLKLGKITKDNQFYPNPKSTNDNRFPEPPLAKKDLKVLSSLMACSSQLGGLAPNLVSMQVLLRPENCQFHNGVALEMDMMMSLIREYWTPWVGFPR